MKLRSTTLLFVFYLLSLFGCTLGSFFIPQRTAVTYANEKYLYNASTSISRYGRRSPYYYNIHGGLYYSWGNNVTIHLMFFEYQQSQYKRSFFEIHMKLCDMLQRDAIGKLFTAVLAKNNHTCPLVRGLYQLYNITLPTENIPNILPFQKGKAEVTFRQLPRNDVISTEVIFERSSVDYFNKKYLSNATTNIRRTGRDSPYYMNVEGTSLFWAGDNVTLHGVFYEFLSNVYKRSFVELELNLCDLVNKEPWYTLLGATMVKRGFLCPTPPGTYRFPNMTISTVKLPYVWPFEKAMLEGKAYFTTTKEMIVRGRFYVTLKRDIPKGK